MSWVHERARPLGEHIPGPSPALSRHPLGVSGPLAWVHLASLPPSLPPALALLPGGFGCCCFYKCERICILCTLLYNIQPRRGGAVYVTPH